jgi:hypothetical protein
MWLEIRAAKIAVILAMTLVISIPAFAQDVIELNEHDTPQLSGIPDEDQPNINEGANASMSGVTQKNSDIPMCTVTKSMSLHMAYTPLRPDSDADHARAAVLVTDLQHALAKYKDYHVAEADGFKAFHPEFKQKVVHFTKNWNGLKAVFEFVPTEPTSLLYQPTPGGGYKLIGAMYTDRKYATNDQLDQRVPLSVARWHRHVNLCFPTSTTAIKTADWTKFVFNGSIATKAACDAAGGHFFPQVLGWMVHVYPWETNPQLVWAQ